MLAAVLAVLVAVPAPVLAQTIRLSVETPSLSATAVPNSLSPLLAAPSLSPASLSPLSASIPLLPAPAIQPLAAAIPVSLPAVPAAFPAAAEFRPAPSAPERPADLSVEAAKSQADARFDASATRPESGAVPVLAPAVVARTSALGRATAPRHWLEKGKVIAAYGGLTAAGLAFHAPFDRIAPLVLAVIMSPLVSVIWGIFYSAAQQGATAAAPKITTDRHPEPATLERLSRLAAEAKLPPPARVGVLGTDEVQAFAGAHDAAGYEIQISAGLEKLPVDEQEAILRHELAHIRHHDAHWTMATMFMTPLPVSLVLLGMIDKPDALGWLAGAIAATSILLFPASLKHSEYLADQYAASKPEGAGPLARFFLRDAPNPERAASALSGKAFSSETGWTRAALLGWDRLKTLFSAHPSHDQRVARLARVADKPR